MFLNTTFVLMKGIVIKSTGKNYLVKVENGIVFESILKGKFRIADIKSTNPVVVGDKVEIGSVVGIVEAMKLFNEIESEVSGTIVKVLVDDMSPVEYDQPMFLVDPN